MTKRPTAKHALDRPTPAPLSTRVDTTPRARVRVAGGGRPQGGGGEGAQSVSRAPFGAVSPSPPDSLRSAQSGVYPNQKDPLPGGGSGSSGSSSAPTFSKSGGKIPASAAETSETFPETSRPSRKAPLTSEEPGVSFPSGGSSSPSEGEEVIEAGRNAYESLLALCRTDVNAFNEFVLRDEETGERIEQAPMHLEMQRCYEKDKFVIVLAHPESGKTQQFVGRTLHELGNNPGLRTVFLNNGQDGAKKNLSSVKKYIERSEELRAVFPKLRPGSLWREDAITVEREGFARDPSIYCLGFHGNILGARIDRAVVDDLLDFENTRTPQARADASSWFKRTFLTRLTRDAHLAFLTNAWHEEDLAHELEDDGWAILRYPVLDAKGQSTWPERWTLERIALWRRRLGELEFARMFLCEPRDPGAMSFRPEWLRNALRRGIGYGFAAGIVEAPLGSLIVTGCDLGASKKVTGGASTMMTVVHYPGGTRQLIAARSGRYSGGELIRNLADVGERYGGVIIVEDNGIQKHIVDLANEEGALIPVPVLPFQTGRNRHDVVLGVDAMASEFEANRWILPSGRKGKETPPIVKKLLAEARAYSPGSHPGDHLMGVWFARTWGLQKMRRLANAKPNGGTVHASVFG